MKGVVLMKDTGVVRKIDPLGRLVIPIEVRRELGLNENEPVEMYVENKRVIIEKYNPSCLICGATENVKKINEKSICDSCINRIKEL